MKCWELEGLRLSSFSWTVTTYEKRARGWGMNREGRLSTQLSGSQVRKKMKCCISTLCGLGMTARWEGTTQTMSIACACSPRRRSWRIETTATNKIEVCDICWRNKVRVDKLGVFLHIEWSAKIRITEVYICVRTVDLEHECQWRTLFYL